jgi:hypothetical protein
LSEFSPVSKKGAKFHRGGLLQGEVCAPILQQDDDSDSWIAAARWLGIIDHSKNLDLKCRSICLLIVSIVSLFATHSHAQHARGELQIEVRDVAGASLGAAAELVSEGNQFRRTFPVAAILNQVDLERGRVRPSLSFDAAAGLEIYREQQRSASLQIQATDLTNRVNVINFASLFSGTAVAPSRSLSARLFLTF